MIEDPPLQLESTWTAPRYHCPHPERWHATDSDSTEVEVTALIAAFVTALRPDFVIETGTNIGHTAYAIGRALQAAPNNDSARLLTMETDPNFVDIARERCAGLPVDVHHGSSLNWDPFTNMNVLPGPLIDFAFFDSLVQIRHLEFERFLPWMHDNTVIGFHDTGPQHPVKDHLDQLCMEGQMLYPLYLPTPRGVCFTRVSAQR